MNVTRVCMTFCTRAVHDHVVVSTLTEAAFFRSDFRDLQGSSRHVWYFLRVRHERNITSPASVNVEGHSSRLRSHPPNSITDGEGRLTDFSLSPQIAY